LKHNFSNDYRVVVLIFFSKEDIFPKSYVIVFSAMLTQKRDYSFFNLNPIVPFTSILVYTITSLGSLTIKFSIPPFSFIPHHQHK